MKKVYVIIGILGFVAVALQCVNIYLANTLDSKSMYVAGLQQKVNKIEQENLILKSQVLDATSFESVASRAAGLGFAPEKDFISLSAPSVVAVGR